MSSQKPCTRRSTTVLDEPGDQADDPATILIETGSTNPVWSRSSPTLPSTSRSRERARSSVGPVPTHDRRRPICSLKSSTRVRHPLERGRRSAARSPPLPGSRSSNWNWDWRRRWARRATGFAGRSSPPRISHYLRLSTAVALPPEGTGREPAGSPPCCYCL